MNARIPFKNEINWTTVIALVTAVGAVGMNWQTIRDHERRLVILEQQRIDDDKATTLLRESIAGRLATIETNLTALLNIARARGP